ncbi:uncharacterized protein AB9W97_005629 [Spinachia spinachia]
MMVGHFNGPHTRIRRPEKEPERTPGLGGFCHSRENDHERALPKPFLQVAKALEKEPEDQGQWGKVGDWVRVKVHKRKWKDPRWTGPYEVKEVTTHSVQVKGKSGAPWHHLTHCAPAPSPSRTLQEVRADLAKVTN